MNEADRPVKPAPGSEEQAKKARELEMLLHFSVLAYVVVPFLGIVAPIVIWQIKKEEFPSLTPHAHVVLNWLISGAIYFFSAMFLCFALMAIPYYLGFPPFFALIGFPIPFALAILAIVFPVVGGIKAGNGEVWPYPLSIPFFK